MHSCTARCSARRRYLKLGIEVSLIEVFVNTSQFTGPFELVDAPYDTEGVGVDGWSRELWASLIVVLTTLLFSFQNTTYDAPEDVLHAPAEK
jgi:hypothetical protein